MGFIRENLYLLKKPELKHKLFYQLIFIME